MKRTTQVTGLLIFLLLASCQASGGSLRRLSAPPKDDVVVIREGRVHRAGQDPNDPTAVSRITTDSREAPAQFLSGFLGGDIRED